MDKNMIEMTEKEYMDHTHFKDRYSLFKNDFAVDGPYRIDNIVMGKGQLLEYVLDSEVIRIGVLKVSSIVIDVKIKDWWFNG